MRKIAEIRNDIKVKSDQLKAMDRTDVENLTAATDELKGLTTELEAAYAVEAAEQRAAEQQISVMEQSAGRRFSFTKFLREAAEGKLSGLEAEVADLGKKEYERMGLQRKGYVIPSAFLRASAGQNYTTNADGGYLKEQMPNRYVDALRDRLVIGKLGATMLGDLVGTVPVCSVGEIAASWEAEGATTSVSKATVARVALTPHRASVVAAFSKDLLAQTSLDVEAILMERILNAHATLIENAAINGTGLSNQPTGILSACATASREVAAGANGAAISWANVVKLESMINADNANRGKMGYLCNAKTLGDMKTIAKAANTAAFIYDGDGMLNGYPVEWTNLVPSNITQGTSTSNTSKMIFGNWEDLYIGQWAGLDIIVDPYTLAANGDVRLVLNAYNDVAVVEPKSFYVLKGLTH